MTDLDPGFEAIAIVGMAGRFPGAANLDEFWDNLVAERESLTEFTIDEIVASGVPRDTLIESRRRTRGVLDGATEFDAGFFGFSPREAEIMDPQQRTFLEVSWEALEDAGYDSERAPGPVGVYAGSGINTYFSANVETRPDVMETFGRFGATVLNEKDFLSTRVAYAMDLKGPAISVQTACSTSLVAVCYAAQGLLNYECDVAIAGGAAALFPQTHSSIHEEGGMISQDGHCRPFDENASGTLFSDGVGAVILRRLSDALADGDNIRAVIRGFAVNNDGAAKAGFTAPSVDGQAEVIQAAQELAGVSPETITYIEAHGTATRLGDPIEIAALTKAFRVGTDENQFCGVGSVKSNIGHLDVAAGVAGIIKTTLALENATIPGTINHEQPSTQVNWEDTPFHVVAATTEWDTGTAPRRAGVSSFGIGGTNAHVVMEEAPTIVRQNDAEEAELLVLAARSATALDNATQRLADHLASTDDPLGDVAFTLQTGRRAFGHRRAIVADTTAEAAELLNDGSSRRVLTGATSHRRKPVVFMFSGQGSQYANMGRDLYEGGGVFRDTVDRCAEILEPILGYDIRGVIFPASGAEDEATEQLKQTGTTQPALFVIEYALAMQWKAWGVEPTAMVGHSIGEYVAACLAGVFTLEDALSLVAARGRLMQSLPAGAMISVPLTEAQVEPLLDDRTCVSVINSEEMVVVSGEFDAIEALETRLADQGIQARRLQTSHAFHSPMMEPILGEFRDEIVKAQPIAPSARIQSNVTGTWMTDEQAIDPDYWAQHLRQAVRFSDCLGTLLTEPDAVFLEVGPGRTLSSLTRMHSAKTADTDVLTSTRHPEETGNDHATLLENLGRLWIAGGAVDWNAVNDTKDRRRVSLPPYPFEHQDYWLEPGAPAGYTAPERIGEPASPATTVEDGPAPVAAISPDGDDYEALIISLWEDLLGVDGIRPDEDFFELGGTSLVAARMFALLGKRTGIRLPLSALVNAPTAALLAATLRETAATASDTEMLVEIQRGNADTPPLFLIHPEGGNVLMYRDLSRHLPEDWTVFGIQSAGIDGVSAPSDSVEEMAADYIAELKTVQPEGPYVIGGYCLGGAIAYEMAIQLRAQNDHVAWVGMIQARHPSYWESRDEAGKTRRLRWKLVDRVAYEREEASEFVGAAKLSHYGRKTRRSIMKSWAGMPNDRPRSAEIEELAINNACNAAHNRAYWEYDPPTYDGRVTVIRSGRQPRGVDPDPTLGWGDLLTGEVQLHEIPAFHTTIMYDERAAAAAEAFRSDIVRALDQGEGGAS